MGNSILRGLLAFNDVRLEGIVDHHCLNVLFIEKEECQDLGQTFFSINFSGYITSTNLKGTTVRYLRHTKVSVVLKDMNKKKTKP